MDKELQLCECGCGQETNMYRGKPRRFISGHQNRGIKVYDQMKHKIGAEGITQDMVRELFDYRDGELYWKESGSGRKIGNIAGTIRKSGYRTIGIGGKIYFTHRLIFLYHHGYLPRYLDHIDGDPSNNDINNIREATHQQNQMNRKKDKHINGKPTSSEYKGVSWDKHRKKWRVYIMIDYKLKHLGMFTSEIEAAEVYNVAAIKHFGKFACLNIIPKRLYASTTTPIHGVTK